MVEMPVNTDEQTFSQVLSGMVESRYKSQTAFARDLGMKYSMQVSRWFTGKAVPAEGYMGRIVNRLGLHEHELERLNKLHQDQVALGKGRIGLIRGSPAALRWGVANMKPSEDPFDLWMQEFCKERQITQISLANSLGFVHSIHGRTFGLGLYYEILDQAPEILKLNKGQQQVLVEAVAASIEKQMTEGRQFGRSENTGYRSLRKLGKITCKTYTKKEAAELLEVSLSTVSNLKRKYCITPQFLTDEDIEKFRNRNTHRGRPKRSRP